MSINLLTQYPTQVGPVVAGWPLGEPRNITAPGDGTGTPWEAAIIKDTEGLKQALLTSAGITPSGTPDKVTASEYLQAIIELASGRAYTYDESGVANTYDVDIRANQQAPASYFDGMIIRFTPGNDNTSASTVDVNSLGTKNILKQDGVTALTGGELTTTKEIELKYNGTNFVLTSDIVTGIYDFGNVAASSDAGEVNIIHGLGTDDIDFGASLETGTSYTGSSSASSFMMLTSNNRMVIGINSQSASTPVIVTAPAAGNIKVDVHNEHTVLQSMKLHWWARRRNA